MLLTHLESPRVLGAAAPAGSRVSQSAGEGEAVPMDPESPRVLVEEGAGDSPHTFSPEFFDCSELN